MLASCPGVVQALDWARAAGEVRSEAPEMADPALAPLRLFGWAPAAVERVPAPSVRAQGHITPGRIGRYYGDGSCMCPQWKGCESAAWSLVFDAGTDEWLRRSAVMAGLFGSSFRGELMAMIQFFSIAGPCSSYVGDCQSVIDAVLLGVPPHLAAASSRDADLWVQLRRCVRNRRGEGLAVHWTKAHRSRAAVEGQGADAVRTWLGNREADAVAKGAARQHVAKNRCASLVAAQQLAARQLPRLAVAAALDLDRGKGMPRWIRRRSRNADAAGGYGGHDPIPVGSGGWRCSVCRVRAVTKASLRTFRAVPCKGSFLARVHGSHNAFVENGVVWCGRCGAYGIEKVVSLARPCPGHPPTPSNAHRLAALRDGVVPAVSQPAAARLEPVSGPRPPQATSVVRGRARPPRGRVSPVGVYLRLQPEVAAERGSRRDCD